MEQLQISRTIPASRERLFAAWLDPDRLRRFMCPAPGVTVSSTQVDARVGGAFEIVMAVGDRQLPHRGVYEAIDPPARLVFTWESDNAPPGSRVEVVFTELESNGTQAQTRITLTHTGLSSPEEISDHERGWTHILEHLQTGDTPDD